MTAPEPRTAAQLRRARLEAKRHRATPVDSWLRVAPMGAGGFRLTWTADPDPWVALLESRQVLEAVDLVVLQAVADCRGQGYSWGDLATALGVSRQAVQQRYGEAAHELLRQARAAAATAARPKGRRAPRPAVEGPGQPATATAGPPAEGRQAPRRRTGPRVSPVEIPQSGPEGA